MLHDHGLLGELFKQVLPLTGELAKRTLGHKKDSSGSRERSQCVEDYQHHIWESRWHSPLGDHEDVGLIDLRVGKIFVLGVTSVLDFLRKEE